MEIFIGFYAAIIILCITFLFSFGLSWVLERKPNRIKRETEARKEVMLKLCYDMGFELGKTGDCTKEKVTDNEFYPYTCTAFLRGYFDGKDAKEKGVK